jgi:hypothetical protein
VGRHSKLRRSEHELRELVARQATSGLTIGEFCQKHGLTLYHFRRIRELVGEPLSSPTFIRVPSTNEHRLTLSFKGYELSFPLELLHQVIQQLQAA